MLRICKVAEKPDTKNTRGTEIFCGTGKAVIRLVSLCDPVGGTQHVYR
jgi:hypothetical protein